MIYRILTGWSRARHCGCGCGCDCDGAAVHGPPLLPRLPVPTVMRGAPERSRLSNLQTTCGAAHAAPSRLAPSGGGASDNQRLSALYPGPGSLPFDRTVPAIHHPPSAICQRRGAISFPAAVARTLRFHFRPCFARQLRASGTQLHQDLSGRRRGGCPRGAVTVCSLNTCAPARPSLSAFPHAICCERVVRRRFELLGTGWMSMLSGRSRWTWVPVSALSCTAVGCG